MPYYVANIQNELHTIEAASPAAAKAAFGAHAWRIREMAEFDSEEQAWESFHACTEEEECKDNYRFAYHDDSAAMAEYERQREDGCCGFYDTVVRIGERIASMGMNYGH